MTREIGSPISNNISTYQVMCIFIHIEANVALKKYKQLNTLTFIFYRHKHCWFYNKVR